MTGDLNMMVKFRDLQVAEAVGKKAALGWFDMEFTMYGCAYLDPMLDKMCFRISECPEDIWNFVRASDHKGFFASRVVHMTRKYPVPSGMKNLIAQDVQKMLAHELQKQYPRHFFKALRETAEMCTTNAAEGFLRNETERLEGVFEKEALARFLEQATYFYNCCALSATVYNRFLQWHKEEMLNVMDDAVSKDIFEATLYGMGYEEHGTIRYMANANQGTLYNKVQELEEKGCFVGPVMMKRYWYNYTYRLPDVIADFKKLLREIYSPTLLQNIKELICKTEIQKRQAQILFEDTKETWDEEARKTMEGYLCRWGLR
ncbi:MAG: hypothetical protein UDB11_09710 [Peptococcaceae bacterium]|nr:hypothetical protein [Peptococcaceae bacterium]